MKALAKEKDLLEREKWDLRRQSKEAMEQANLLRSHMDTKENRIKELEAELTMVCVCVWERGGLNVNVSVHNDVAVGAPIYPFPNIRPVCDPPLCVCQAKQSLATLTKDVPKRHSVAMPNAAEPVVNGSQEWVMQADLPLTAAIRQSQQTLYHGHTSDRQGRPLLSTSPWLHGLTLFTLFRAGFLSTNRVLTVCVCVCVCVQLWLG